MSSQMPHAPPIRLLRAVFVLVVAVGAVVLLVNL
jgi:hypothetical protein